MIADIIILLVICVAHELNCFSSGIFAEFFQIVYLCYVYFLGRGGVISHVINYDKFQPSRKILIN